MKVTVSTISALVNVAMVCVGCTRTDVCFMAGVVKPQGGGTKPDVSGPRPACRQLLAGPGLTPCALIQQCVLSRRSSQLLCAYTKPPQPCTPQQRSAQSCGVASSAMSKSIMSLPGLSVAAVPLV